MNFLSNISDLKVFAKKAPRANKIKIEKIIELYETKKITNYRTALNAVIKLSNPVLFRSGDADKDYEKVVIKYQNAEPMKGRLKREIEKKTMNLIE